MTTLARAALIGAMTLICAGVRAQTPGAGFTIMDLLPGKGPAYGWGYAVSEDGNVIVGVSARGSEQGRAVRWHASGRLETLPTSSVQSSIAFGVSPDGATILGFAHPNASGGPRAVFWRGGLLHPLPGIGGSTRGIARGISADGRVIGGQLNLPNTAPHPAFVRWVDGEAEDLSTLPGDAVPLYPATISGDGNVMVGLGIADDNRAIRVGTRVDDLGDLPGAPGATDGRIAHGASLTGARIAGNGNSARYPFSEAFLWSEPTGMIALGIIPATVQLSAAFSISDDGRVAAGASGSNRLYEFNAFLWDAVHGMRSLNAIVDGHGVNRDGWFIDTVYDLNSNGTVMTGMARKGAEQRAFLVTLPPWCHADCDGSGDIDFNDFLCFLNRYNRAQADPRAHPVDFVYCDFALDDTIDFADVLEYLRRYSAGCGR